MYAQCMECGGHVEARQQTCGSCGVDFHQYPDLLRVTVPPAGPSGERDVKPGDSDPELGPDAEDEPASAPGPTIAVDNGGQTGPQTGSARPGVPPTSRLSARPGPGKVTRRILLLGGALAIVVVGFAFVGGSDTDARSVIPVPMFGGGTHRVAVFESVGPSVHFGLDWSHDLGGSVFATPAVLGDMVIGASTTGEVVALDQATSSIQWKVGTEGPVWSSPAVSDDMVFVGSFDGHLYAIAGLTGRVAWRYPTEGRIWSSPVVSQGIVFVGSHDGHVHAVRAEDGSGVWTTAVGGEVWSSPAVRGATLVVGSRDGAMYALNADTGEILWRTSTGGEVRSTPAISGERVYVGSFDNAIYALELTDGSIAWRFETGGPIWGSPASDGGTVYVGSDDGFMRALNARDGALRWSQEIGVGIGSSPSLIGALLLFGAADGVIRGFDASDGSSVWQFSTGDQVGSSTVSNGQAIYVGSNDGMVYRFLPTATSSTPSPTPSGMDESAGEFRSELGDLMLSTLTVASVGDVELTIESGPDLQAIARRIGRAPGASTRYRGTLDPSNMPGPWRIMLTEAGGETLDYQEFRYDADRDTWSLQDRGAGETSAPQIFQRTTSATPTGPATSPPTNQQRMTLQAGFRDDPRILDVRVRGTVSAEGMAPGCVGYVHTEPTLILDYTASSVWPLHIYAIGATGVDANLMIRTPRGQILCNDDFHGLDPAILIPTPDSGEYQIWVGLWSGGTGMARLLISEREPDFSLGSRG